MSEALETTQPIVRQWVTLQNSSMDVRIGTQILKEVPRLLKSALGRPYRFALVYDATAREVETASLCALHARAEGFEVFEIALEAPCCTFASLEELANRLADAHITADDIVVAFGGSEVLSLAQHVCASWCESTSLALIPTDIVTALTALTNPEDLRIRNKARLWRQHSVARFAFVDCDFFNLDPHEPSVRLAYAHLIITALIDAESALGALWDRAQELHAQDIPTWIDQLQETIKARGVCVASAALATRQSLECGSEFAQVLQAYLPEVPYAVLLAQSLSFVSRLSVARELLSKEDLETIDELLDRFGLIEDIVLPQEATPEQLVADLKAYRFEISQRFVLALPYDLGRVRLTTIDDEQLLEHLTYWCATRYTSHV